MTKKTLLALSAAALAISACTTSQPIAMTAVAVPTDPTVTNGDVLAARRAEGADIPALRGSEFVTVRTYQYVPGTNGRAKREELTGVPCILLGEGYSAQIVTPGQARVPDYGYASPSISVQCQQAGYRDGIGNVTAFNATESGRMNAAAGGGLIGVVGMGIINAASSDRNDDFKYPEVAIVMNRTDCETQPGGCRSR